AATAGGPIATLARRFVSSDSDAMVSSRPMFVNVWLESDRKSSPGHTHNVGAQPMSTQSVVSSYELVVGMEVHAQALTASKMFCRCGTDYQGAPPNTRVCPTCLALPGALPVINQAAVEATIRTGLALNCTINETAVFARKNYTYPDLPKGYQ